MLTFTNSDQKQGFCFHLLGTSKPAAKSTNLLSDDTSLLSNNTSLLSSGGGEDTCSFYSGPSDETIMAFGEQSESCGAIAYGGESESCGSIACSTTGGGFSGGASSSSSSMCCS